MLSGTFLDLSCFRLEFFVLKKLFPIGIRYSLLVVTMFGFMKSPGNKISKQKSVDPGLPASNSHNSDSEVANKHTLNPARRTSSEPLLNYDNKPHSSAPKDRYQNDFHDSGGFENQSVQELENYAVYKSEETTSSVNNCLRIAEDIRQDATKTLDMLHQQGEQITRTHNMATDIDKDLSKVSTFYLL